MLRSGDMEAAMLHIRNTSYLPTTAFCECLKREPFNIDELLSLMIPFCAKTNVFIINIIIDNLSFPELALVHPLLRDLQDPPYNATFIFSDRTDWKFALIQKAQCPCDLSIPEKIYIIWAICEEVCMTPAPSFDDIVSTFPQCLSIHPDYTIPWTSFTLGERTTIATSLGGDPGNKDMIEDRLVLICAADPEVYEFLNPEQEGLWQALYEHIEAIWDRTVDASASEDTIELLFEHFDISEHMDDVLPSFLTKVSDLFGYSDIDTTILFTNGSEYLLDELKLSRPDRRKRTKVSWQQDTEGEVLFGAEAHVDYDDYKYDDYGPTEEDDDNVMMYYN